MLFRFSKFTARFSTAQFVFLEVVAGRLDMNNRYPLVHNQHSTNEDMDIKLVCTIAVHVTMMIYGLGFVEQ